MSYYRFLFGGFFAVTLVAFVLKSLLLFWSPLTFSDLSPGEQLWALIWGIRFDLAVAAMLFLPVAVGTYALQRLHVLASLSLRWLLFPITILAGMQLADLIYFDHAGRHVSYEIRELIPEFSGLLGTAATDYAPLLLCFVLVCGVGWILTGRRRPVPPPRWWSLELPLLLWLALGVVMIRGSLTDLPMKPDRAYAIGNDSQAVLALNPAYAMISSLLEKDVVTPVYRGAPDPEASFLRHQLGPFLEMRDKEYQPPVRQMNVVLIMLESWPAELMHSYNPKAPRVTPALDQLNPRGLSTDGLIAGGKRTTEGFFSVLCSFQNPLGQAVPNTKLQSQDYLCLPKLLREAGWHVAVFQGMHKGTTGQFTQQLGAASSFGKLDMPRPRIPQNKWGYHDPDLYDFVLEQARRETQPFFYIINTTTTHDTVLPPGEPWAFGRDTEEQRRMSIMNYADRALGDFVRAYEAGNFAPTLFVITADHSAGGRSSNFGYFWIPLTIFATDNSVAKDSKPGVGSQRDIAPTIMDILGGNVPWFSGISLLRDGPMGGEYFTNGVFGWVRDDRLIEFSLYYPEEMRCYERPLENMMNSPRECTPQDKSDRDFLRALTWYSQSLLFSGRTTAFGQKAEQFE